MRYLFTFSSALTSTRVSRVSGIRKATAWYSSHISMIDPKIRGRPKPKPTILLLTDDVQNRIKGEKEGIECSSGKFLPLVMKMIFNSVSEGIRGELGR